VRYAELAGLEALLRGAASGGNAATARLLAGEGATAVVADIIGTFWGTFWSVGAPLPFKGQTGSPIRAFAVVG
jgi:hypothetical protein